MKKYAIPASNERTATVKVGDDLEVDDGLTTVVWFIDGQRIKASNAVSATDVSHQLPTSIADLTNVPRDASEPFMRLWLSERLGLSYSTAIEGALENGVPSLQALYRRHPDVRRMSSVSPRLWEALVAGDTPRDIASRYWGDSSSRSDGTAFVDALAVGDVLDESRVALMSLVPPGDERRKLVAVPTPQVWMIPPQATANVASNLTVPVALVFAAEAIRDARSRLQLTAAQALNIKAAGRDGVVAYRQLLDDVLRSEFSAPRSLTDRVIASGPVAELPIVQVTTERGLDVVAKAARNCLGNPSYPWRSRALRGEVSILAFGQLTDPVAIVAIDPTSGVIVEMKSKGNADVPPQLATAISRRLAQVAGTA